MDKSMRCDCGRRREIALDKHFRTALLCPKCDEAERAAPEKSVERTPLWSDVA